MMVIIFVVGMLVYDCSYRLTVKSPPYREPLLTTRHQWLTVALSIVMMMMMTLSVRVWVGVYLYTYIAQFAITINSNVCPHIRVPNMLMRNPMHDVTGIFNSEARY